MFLEIVTPERTILSAEVDSVTLPGMEGNFQILNNHAPIISILVKGQVKIAGTVTLDEKSQAFFTKGVSNSLTFPIESGVVEMKDNKVVVLAD